MKKATEKTLHEKAKIYAAMQAHKFSKNKDFPIVYLIENAYKAGYRTANKQPTP